MTEELEKRVEKLEKKVEKLEELISDSRGSELPKRSSIQEFLQEKNASSKIEKVLYVGYYLEHYVNMESFNASDLENFFRRAKEKPPANVNDLVNKNISKGLIMEHTEKKDGRKSWVLTNDGEKSVKNEN